MDLEQKKFMKMYYKSLFPLEQMFKWLRIDENREVSFGLSSKSYLRFLTFGTVEEFASELLNIVPERIDIGAIYKDRPMKHNHPKVVGKELVFDIDLTDYPRTCCTGKGVCDECFTLVKVAVRVLNYSLREEFGFESIRFVFSGRRGVHCWVTDDVAKNLNDSERGEIVRYYNAVIDRKVYSEEYSRILMEYSYLALGQDRNMEPSEEELFDRMYLRLDKEVTQKTRHLIKAPFSVHPDTGIIAVPIDPDRVEDIGLNTFPRLKDVIECPERLTPYLKILETWL